MGIGQDELRDFSLWIHQCLHSSKFSYLAGPLPQAGLANSAGTKSLVTSRQTQVLLFYGKKNPGYLTASGHVSNDHLERTQSGPSGTAMSV